MPESLRAISPKAWLYLVLLTLTRMSMPPTTSIIIPWTVLDTQVKPTSKFKLFCPSAGQSTPRFLYLLPFIIWISTQMSLSSKSLLLLPTLTSRLLNQITCLFSIVPCTFLYNTMAYSDVFIHLMSVTS